MRHDTANPFLAAGSLEALRLYLDDYPVDGEIVILATAAAFLNISAASAGAEAVLGQPVRTLPVATRSAALEPESRNAVLSAGLTVCLDGAALHARSVWRNSPLGDALCEARVAAIGSVASVFGTVMIDPRGGAPTTGLGRFDDAALYVEESPEQTRRTKELLGAACLCIALDATALVRFDGTWAVLSQHPMRCTRGDERVALGLGDRH
jgi:hypothetical protein